MEKRWGLRRDSLLHKHPFRTALVAESPHGWKLNIAQISSVFSRKMKSKTTVNIFITTNYTDNLKIHNYLTKTFYFFYVNALPVLRYKNSMFV